MNDQALWARLTQVFRETFEDPGLTIGPSTSAREIREWDSLAHIQLLVATEKAFNVRFNSAELLGLKTVGEMAELLSRRTSAA